MGDGEVRKRRADGIATRSAILNAAADEFAEKGYELASVRAVCARAGVNVALANRYFGSKEELYRTTAKMLFGDLGAPLAVLADEVTDAATWQAAVREWIDDFLYMSLPTQPAQRRCAALFRHEATRPTVFHAEFKEAFGRPVHEALRRLLGMAVKDEAELDLWMTSVWAQVSVYALADKAWHKSFRPKGVKDAEWAARVRDHLCRTIFASLKFRSGDDGRARTPAAPRVKGGRR